MRKATYIVARDQDLKLTLQIINIIYIIFGTNTFEEVSTFRTLIPYKYTSTYTYIHIHIYY